MKQLHCDEVILYSWPYSQLCLSCSNKIPYILDDSAALCGVNCVESDGVECPEYREADDESLV